MGFTLEIGAQAPDFKLPGVDGKDWSLGDFADQKIVVVVVSCNSSMTTTRPAPLTSEGRS